MSYPETLETFAALQPGDRVEVTHGVKVGFRHWNTQTLGTVVSKDRRRHSLHYNRNFDDKVYSDVLILKRDIPGPAYPGNAGTSGSGRSWQTAAK